MEKAQYQVKATEHTKCQPLILIIDDSKFMHIYIKNLLTKIGYRVICASNGLEGAQLFQENNPAIVLIDAIMPVMDGFMTCATIRNMDGGKDALILMITKETAQSYVDKAFRVGFDDYFVKPLLDGVFIARMKKLLQDKCFGKICSLADRPPGQIQNELKEARALQMSLLPKPLSNPYLSVNTVYSPYDRVSGDYLDYWWSDKDKTLYGYLLDATGHSIASAMQVCALRMMFCEVGKSGLSLNSMLGYINFAILKNQYRYIATAIMFGISFKDKKIYYASAGISPFYIFDDPDSLPTPILTAGFPLGYKMGADYTIESVPLTGVKKVIFATDGFADLFSSKTEIAAKHDDASAALITIKK